MNFTENALNQLKKLIEESENPKSGVRFYTAQGCCSPSLQMGFVENPAPNDVVLDMSGVNIFVTPDAQKLLADITLDYTEAGFRAVKSTTGTSQKKCC